MILEQLEEGKYKLSVKPGGIEENFNFEEQKDMFLFNRNKTIGFRKDKKINKFVGLRSGYSKQLELSILSVSLDGVDKIPKNRVNFNSVTANNDIIIHNIGNMKFYNTVSNTNYKNMLEIKNSFDKLEIIYEITTKGLKISNRLGGNRYSAINDQFIFVDNGNNQPMFILDTPVVLDADSNEYNIVEHRLYTENGKLLYKKTINAISNKYKFPLLIDINIQFNIDISLMTSGIGVISSSDTDWNNTKAGLSTLTIISNNSLGTEEFAVGAKETGGTYTLNRTYLTFNTSMFSGFTDVLASVKLKYDNYWNSDEGIVVMEGIHNNTITIADWNNFGNELDNISIIDSGDINEFNLPLTTLNTIGLTKLVLLSMQFDSGTTIPDTGVTSFSGIDFGKTKLEVIYEPIKVYGQTILNVNKGDYFNLDAYTNSGNTAIERENNRAYIEWYNDSGYTQYICSGATLNNAYSIQYQLNNHIYAVIPISGGTAYSVPLIITINVMQYDWNTIPDRTIDYDEIDIDSIYFKFHKCLSGICYTYVRDIENIYEGFPLVSDAWGNESYNMYNEFDIIDEFFSNSHEVEVAYNKNLDLTKRHNDLDNVTLREGTRVLLSNQTDVTELGVYVVQFDNTLKKTNELNTYDDCFRYKAHVGAGTYADQEIHVWPILPPPNDIYISITPNPITLMYLSGITDIVAVESNTTWTLYENVPWLNVDASEGSDYKLLTLTTAMMNSTSITRTGIIEFTGYGGVTTILTVYQTPYIEEEAFRITTDNELRTLTDESIRLTN